MGEAGGVPQELLDCVKEIVAGAGEGGPPFPDRGFARALLESMSDGVVACDADGMLVLFNRVAREWHGVEPLRLGGAEWPSHYDLYRWDGVTPLTPEEVPLARAFRGEAVVDAEMAIAARGQPVRFILANGSTVRDAAGGRIGAVVVMRDVTELRRASAELRGANEALAATVGERGAQLALQHATLRGILDGAAGPIFSVDRDYRYTSFNRSHAEAMAALYGAQIELGRSVLECMTVPEDARAARQNLDRALAGEAHAQEAFSGEDARTRRWFEVTHSPIRSAAGEVIGVAVFARDLTDRRRAEEELRESEGRYRAIFDNVLDGIYLLDVLPDGRFRTAAVNPALERATGVPRTVSVGRTQEEAVGEETARIVNAKYRRCVEAGAPIEEEVALDLPAGRRWFHSSLIPARGPDGRITRIVGITRDITARRQSEAVDAARLHLMQFAAGHTVDELMEETLNELERLTGSAIGFFHLVDEQAQALTLQAWSTRTKAEFCTAGGHGSHYPLASAGVWVDCVHRREPVIHNDYAALPHRKGTPEGHPPVVRELVVPVMRGSKVKAVLGVGNKAVDYGVGDVQCVSLLADLAWEIAERKRSEEAIRRLNRQLRAISECNQALMHATDEQRILSDVCRIFCERAGYRLAWVGYLEHDAARSIRPVAMAGADGDWVAGARLSWGAGDGPGAAALRAGASVVAHAPSPGDGDPWLAEAADRGDRAVIAVPLKDPGAETFGLLFVHSAEPDAFGGDELALLDELAGDLAFGVSVLRGRARHREAERSVALLSFALDNVREAAFLLDEEGALRYVNDAACRALGWAREELLRRRVADVDPELTAAGWAAHWRELREKGSISLERRHRTRDGRVYPVEVHASYFEFEGQPYNLALAHDVTERHRLEEQLRQSQKMEAIGTLAGGIAHDFNNVLTGIVGYGNMLQEELGADHPLQESVQEILGAADRAAQLTRGLLAFSRKQVIKPRPVDLNGIVRDVERLLRRLIGEDVELAAAVASSPLVVMADAGQIEQVLMNLATNARDAMPAGGLLSIATRRAELDAGGAAAHGLGAPGAYAELAVSDTGAGMDAATREKAFEPFFTTKAPGKGTGLGLSIVYGIVKQHGGAISVYSEPGRGTSVKVLFPLVAAAVERVPAPAEAPPAGGTETILLAEDDRVVRKMVGTVLRDHGYRVLEAVDGADALEQYAADAARIDLLVLDVVMPKKSGREVYDAVRGRRADVPVLFLSGYTADIIHKKGIFEEGLEFMSKPLSPSDLLRRVRGILDRRGSTALRPDRG